MWPWSSSPCFHLAIHQSYPFPSSLLNNNPWTNFVGEQFTVPRRACSRLLLLLLLLLLLSCIHAIRLGKVDHFKWYTTYQGTARQSNHIRIKNNLILMLNNVCLPGINAIKPADICKCTLWLIKVFILIVNFKLWMATTTTTTTTTTKHLHCEALQASVPMPTGLRCTLQ